MALITIPRLPEAPDQYSRQQMATLISTLEQMIFILNNTYTPETLRDEDEAFAFFLGAGGTTTSEIETDVETNTTNIATNTTNIASNTTNIATNTTNIATNTSNITTNANAITTANGNITTNANAITTANSNITTNTNNITKLTRRINYLTVTR
jgi:methyl-accepting chemotaxis protein